MYKALEDGSKITRFITKKNKCEDSFLKVSNLDIKVKNWIVNAFKSV